MASLLDTVQAAFGKAFSISRGYSSGHDGLDLPAPIGTPIHAVAAGVVEYARDARTDPNCLNAWSCGGGNVVNVNIGDKKAVQYAHLSRIAVSSGSPVIKGQVIGYVGDTGGRNSDGSFGGSGSRFVGSHLHLGLWDKAAMRMINPQPLLEGKPMGGVSTPTMLGGFGNLISFPVGYTITAEDTHTVSDTLSKGGMFENPIQQIAFEEWWKNNAVGKTWNKQLQDQLAGIAFDDANNVTLGGILPDVPGAIMFIGVLLVGITFLLLGGIIVLRKPSQ